MFDFTDQRVIVTGGTRGIGAAITRSFLDAGAQVIASYVSNENAAQAFRSTMQDPDRLRLERFDVSDYAQVERFFAGLEVAPQVVVNNAGIRKDQIVGLLPADDWRRVMAVNLDGTFFMSKMAVKAMSRQRYGRIINITSPSGRLGFPGQAGYAASKAGQVALMRTLSKEVARRKITVNCVSPGFVDTELLADLTEEHRQGFLGMVPLGRFGDPEEVAYAVLFLATKEAAYITGHTLEVTGGI